MTSMSETAGLPTRRTRGDVASPATRSFQTADDLEDGGEDILKLLGITLHLCLENAL